MAKEFNLSEKIRECSVCTCPRIACSEKDIKEFIKRSQAVLHVNITNSEELEKCLFGIDKLAGDKLI